MGLKSDVKEIKRDVKKMLSDQAVHTEVLRTHEKRSNTLEGLYNTLQLDVTRLKDHDKLWTKLAAILAAALVGGLAQALIHHFTSAL